MGTHKKVKTCINCSKFISHKKKYNKFCSISCSTTYNNKTKKNYSYSENLKTSKCIKCDTEIEVKINTSNCKCNNCKSKKCKYCKTIIPSNKKSCCVCARYYRLIPMFKKLGIYKIGIRLKALKFKALGILCNEYFINHLSLPEIQLKYNNLNLNTLHKFFNNCNIKIRSLSDSNQLKIKNGQPLPHKQAVYKHGWHITWAGKKVYYRSSYELDYCIKLDKERIEYETETLRIEYYDTQLEKERIAIPDFYLPELNKIIEIKSDYTFNKQRMKDRVLSYRKNGYNFELVLEKQNQTELVT